MMKNGQSSAISPISGDRLVSIIENSLDIPSQFARGEHCPVVH
jgi:hypothetical protein